MTAPARALIVSAGRDRGALAGARALARTGWVVGAGTPDGGGVLGASRAVTASHTVARPRGDGTAFVAGVRAAVAAGGYDVVFGGSDDWTAALSAYRAELPVPIAHPDYAVVATALDKLALASLAGDAGLATPHTVLATAETLASWHGPVVLKSRSHWLPGQTRLFRIETALFPDAAAARDQVDLICSSGGEALLQRPVRGQLGAVVGLVHEGRLRGRVQQSTFRHWPTPHGMSTRAVTVPVQPDLVTRVETLLRRVGWQGLVELQFLVDDDGLPHLIDLNGRFYGSLALAEAATPGLVDAWGRQAVGAPVPALPDGTPGVRYAWSGGDLRRARRERRGGLLGDLAGTVRWGWGAQHSVWDPRDPGPVRQMVRQRFAAEPPAPGIAAPRRPLVEI